MKPSIILLLLSFLLSTTTSAQSKTFENGIYASFQDLIEGKKVTDVPYREDTKSSKDGVTRYNLFHEGKYRAIKGIYCYVNANHIYLNGRTYGRKGYYIRSHFTGRYTYFEDRLGKEKFEMKRGAPGITPATGAAVTSKIWGILLDMETGKVMKTSRWRMKKILAPYPRLWAEYKRGGKSTNEVRDIILQVNKSAEADLGT